MKVEKLAIVFALAGLGLFLVAVKLMSRSMKNMSSGYVSSFLEKFSKNKWLGLLFGVVFTTMIQSSDGTVALVIGLIGAGLLSLKAAIPIILGANIGTATTAVIVALANSEIAAFKFVSYFPLLVFLGSGIMIFVKEEKKTNAAMLIFAVGTIFLGLKIMGAGMKAITSQEWFKTIVSSVGINPWTSMFTITALTGIAQSSSAITTVVQGIFVYNSSGGFTLSLASAIGMIIGANIGTTFTALVTSIGGRRDAKRIAIIWLFTNFVMMILVMPIISYYAQLIELNQPAQISSIMKFQLGWAHLLFNIFLAFIFIWFTSPLERFSKWIIRDRKENSVYKIDLPLDLINQSPQLAYLTAKNATAQLAQMPHDATKIAYQYLSSKDKKNYHKLKNMIMLIETTRKTLYAYLVEIGSKNISKKIANKHMALVLASRSLERVPILLNELTIDITKTHKKSYFNIPREDYSELIALLKLLIRIVGESKRQLKSFSKSRSKEISDLNDYIDDMVHKFSENHINRKKVSNFDFLLGLKLISRISHHATRVNRYLKRGDKDVQFKKISSKLELEITKELMKEYK